MDNVDGIVLPELAGTAGYRLEQAGIEVGDKRVADTPRQEPVTSSQDRPGFAPVERPLVASPAESVVDKYPRVVAAPQAEVARWNSRSLA